MHIICIKFILNALKGGKLWEISDYQQSKKIRMSPRAASLTNNGAGPPELRRPQI